MRVTLRKFMMMDLTMIPLMMVMRTLTAMNMIFITMPVLLLVMLDGLQQLLAIGIIELTKLL